MKEKIIEVIPEINLISDENLKEQVILAFETALKDNNWQVEDMQKIPFTLLIEETEVSFLDHTRAVTQTSLAIYEKLIDFYPGAYEIEKDIILAGGLLHDIGKLYEYQVTNGRYSKSENGKLIRHPFSGMALASKIGLPDKVLHCIALHAKEGDGAKRIPEANIIHHADFINFENLRDWGKK